MQKRGNGPSYRELQQRPSSNEPDPSALPNSSTAPQPTAAAEKQADVSVDVEGPYEEMRGNAAGAVAHWTDGALFVGVGLAAAFAELVPGVAVKRSFFKGDTSISSPMKSGEIVPAWTLAAIVAATLVLLLCLDLFWLRLRPRVAWSRQLYGSTLGLFVLGIAVDLTKKMVGRLRPDFISRCQPKYAPYQPQDFYPGYQVGVCKGDERTILQGRLSFPSGHAACSFYAMGLLVLYLRHHWPPKKAPALHQLCNIAAALVAITVSVSRVTDNRHHLSDVAVGAAAGLIAAHYFHSWMQLRTYASAHPTHPMHHALLLSQQSGERELTSVDAVPTAYYEA
ncbi:unnamed protein product [Vitrella brassicaformis CCMP3155]|uniref:Phosphatidic acid phosphatase type 2/haloperoxidase domain-containing protein n=1 Tax=Vitrella brassicaformis (strain CCMP3155) TaxID=1169540 RepID=A0A0G4G1X1_VITBC|nr:unnamed protein product [Vitrella brassicaformis CCMP3155]|eukprot:CEM22057.1 unnamed protein product [Vitrella brassicaformis CCMP3155]